MRYREPLILALLILISVAALVGLTWMNYRFSVQNPGGNDFLARWMGARKWVMEGISPYDQSVSLATQKAIYGHPADPEKGEDLSHFIYPMTSMAFFAPFGLLEYLPARALWMTLLELSMAALTIVSMRLVRWQPNPVWTVFLILFSLLWYHGVRTVIIGQFAAIEALLITIALFLIMSDNDVGAGILLALLTSKPQMAFLIIPFVLIWAYSWRRFALIWSFIASLLGLFALSLIFIPTWPLQMIWQLMEYPSYTSRIGSLTSTIAAFVPGLRTKLNIGLQIIFWGYLIVEWVLAWKKDSRWFLWTAMMTLVITNFVALRTATTNYVMLLPVLLLIFKIWRQRWGRVGNWVVGFMLAFLFVGLWLLFSNTVQVNLEQPAMYLPLPLICLFGLWWVRWWLMHPVHLPKNENLV
ncbi:MAG: glycosyltransferase family 87 protein [Chloroflexota bacterium]|nr:glycosyltransferase family 87 protein [Chloroflexota bacterium]